MTSYYQTPSGGLSLTPVTAAQIAVATGTWSPTAVYNNTIVATAAPAPVVQTISVAPATIIKPLSYAEMFPVQYAELAKTYPSVYPAPLGTIVTTPVIASPIVSGTSFGAGWDMFATIGKVFGDLGSILGGTLGGPLGAGISGLTGGVEFGTGILGTPLPPLTSAPYTKVITGAPAVIKGTVSDAVNTVTTVVHDVVVKIVEVPIKLAEGVGDAATKSLFGVDMKTLLILGIGAYVITRK